MKRFLRPVFAMTLVATFVAGGAVAFAQDAPPPAAGPVRKSLIALRCKDDAPKFCANIPAGGGRLAHCLRKHEAELSEPCKAAVAAAGSSVKGPMAAPVAAAAPAAPAPAAAPVPAAAAAAPGPGKHHGRPMPEWGPMHGMHKTCGADVEKFCKEVPPGHGRVAVCLNEHTNELGAGCKTQVARVMEKMNEPMQAHADCAADVQKFCGDVPPGFGRVGFCLGEHTAELAPVCKKHVAEMKTRFNKRPGKGAARETAKPAAPGIPAITPPPAMPPATHAAPPAAPMPAK